MRDVRSRAVYDFSHEKLRELVYEQTSLARRRLLHRRVAEALSRRRGPTAPRSSLSTCDWPAITPGAAEQYRLAGEHAASLLAHADALEHFEAALALGYPDPPALHERIGDLRTLLGDYGGALASYETAAAHGEAAASPAIEHKLGGVTSGAASGSAPRRATGRPGRGERGRRGLRARILADLSLTLHQRGRARRARPSSQSRRADLAEAAADGRAQAQAHNMLGVLALADDASSRRATSSSAAWRWPRARRRSAAAAAALNNLALVARERRRARPRARADRGGAGSSARAQGDRHREAALENNLADLHHAAGRAEEAMDHLKRAVAIFAEVGADEATRLPEIWKLVSW